MLRPAHNPIAGKMNVTRCLLRRQTGSQRDPAHLSRGVQTLLTFLNIPLLKFFSDQMIRFEFRLGIVGKRLRL